MDQDFYLHITQLVIAPSTGKMGLFCPHRIKVSAVSCKKQSSMCRILELKFIFIDQARFVSRVKYLAHFWHVCMA